MGPRPQEGRVGPEAADSARPVRTRRGPSLRGPSAEGRAGWAASLAVRFHSFSWSEAEPTLESQPSPSSSRVSAGPTRLKAGGAGPTALRGLRRLLGLRARTVCLSWAPPSVGQSTGQEKGAGSPGPCRLLQGPRIWEPEVKLLSLEWLQGRLWAWTSEKEAVGVLEKTGNGAALQHSPSPGGPPPATQTLQTLGFSPPDRVHPTPVMLGTLRGL